MKIVAKKSLLLVLVISTTTQFNALQALDYGDDAADAARALIQGAALSAADQALLHAIGDTTKIGQAKRAERIQAAIEAGARLNIRLNQYAPTAIETAANDFFDDPLTAINLILAAAKTQDVKIDQMSLDRALLWATGGFKTRDDAVEQAEILMAAGANPNYIYKPGPDGDKKNILERKIGSLNFKFQRGEEFSLNETLLLVALLTGGAKIRDVYFEKLPFVQKALFLANLERTRAESA
ncbi:MAG TPA: hypothetical protein VJJ81_04490 [Candidatus Babeliales bacterium]|nr:hypothetical protein [Candidatus Babeliales bacterium]